MGATVSIRNETPYTWFYSNSESAGFSRLESNRSAAYGEYLSIWRYIYLRFDDHDQNAFSYEFNTFKGSPTFTIRESSDHFELHCSTEEGVQQCRNYGKQEFERQRRRQEEERRQQQ